MSMAIVQDAFYLPEDIAADPAVMRKVDALVIEYLDTFKCIGETDIDKTYEMPKSVVTYRKPRRLTEEQKNHARSRMKRLNDSKSNV